MTTVRRILRSRWLHGSVVVSVLLFGLIGFAHTPAGRPLLNALRGAPGCPVDLTLLSPANVEKARIAAISKRQGTALEASRRALGFELGVTHKGAVLAYMKKHGVACETSREESVLRCTEAPSELSPGSAPRIDDLHMQFDTEQRLVAVDVFRADASSDVAVAWLKAMDEKLTSEVGPATGKHGEASVSFLEAGALRRTANEYRYQGYVAQLSAMRIGKRGVRVREQYQWVPTGTKG